MSSSDKEPKQKRGTGMKIKKVVSIVLCLTMLVSVFSGLEISAYAENTVSLEGNLIYETVPGYTASLADSFKAELDEIEENYGDVIDYIYDEMLDFSDAISLQSYGIDADVLNSIVYYLIYYKLCYFFDGYSYSYNPSNNVILSFTPYYTFSEEDVEAANDTIRAELISVIKAASEFDTDTEKILYVHDYIVSSLDYDSVSYNQTYNNIYGAIINDRTMCIGYSTFFAYIMNYFGIETYVVRSETLYHVWNLVYLDGEFYNVDCTYDDTDYIDRYVFYKDLSQHYVYRSLIVSDESLQDDLHYSSDWLSNGVSTYGECTSTLYDDFFWQEAYGHIVYANGYWYVAAELDESIGFALYEVEFLSNSEYTYTKVAEVETKWLAPDGYYLQYYTTLQSKGDSVYYMTADAIYLYNPDGDDICIFQSTSDENIYDFVINDNGTFSVIYAVYYDEEGTIKTYNTADYFCAVQGHQYVDGKCVLCNADDPDYTDTGDDDSDDIDIDFGKKSTTGDTSGDTDSGGTTIDGSIYNTATFFYWIYENYGDTDALCAYELLTTGSYVNSYEAVDVTGDVDFNGVSFFDCTTLGGDGDATTLSNLELSINWLLECNAYRTTDTNFTDLDELKVNCIIMAIAELYANYYASNYANYTDPYPVMQLREYGAEDPYASWYVEGKEYYDDGDTTSTKSIYYQILTSSSYTTTGFAYRNDATVSTEAVNSSEFFQVLSVNSYYLNRSYTVSEFSAMYALYIHEINGEHTYEFVSETEATCTEDGVTTYACTVCGDSYEEITYAEGHKYDAVSTASTCTTAGEIVYTCSVCGDTYTVENSVLADHKYVASVTEPTCTEEGYTTYTCSVCGEIYIDDYTEVIDHTFEVTEEVATTCIELGYTVYTCSVCGDSYAVYETEYADHDYVVTAGDATCTESGSATYTCTVCGDSYTVESGEALGHDYVATETVEATCVTDGYIVYVCSRCGDTYTETVGATGVHTEGEAVIENYVDPTCTTAGSYDTVVYCSVCGEELSRETATVSATGHSYVVTSTVEATCTTKGYTVYTCSTCGDSYNVTTSSATGHSYEWVIASNKYPTKTCSVCGDVKVTLAFNDISTETEYFDYIAYTSYYNSLITGVKANSTDTTTETFSPRTSLTRAMLVTILYRMAGSPYDDANPYSKTPFSDVKAGVWYYNAVCWALDNGITTETKFKPNTNVTREQTATFLYRYAGEYLGQDVSTDNDISSYPDASSVSSYAQTAMAWANDKGMITGTQQGYLNPQGTTLRVHATKILYGFGVAYNIGEFEE